MSTTSASAPSRPEHVTYEVVHTTAYRYAAAVSLSQQLLHLAPRDVPRQRCRGHALRIEPAPARRRDDLDPFGNPLTRLEFDRPHAALVITSSMQVTRESRETPLDVADSPAWEEVVECLRYRAGTAPGADVLEAARYRFESPYVRIKTMLAEYARDCFPPRRPLLEATFALMQKIHREFAYDPAATEIETPLLDVFARRRGVCQDFAHLLLACLRSLGLAARYVSGYLRTTPRPGKPRLVGADASHAWISLYCPRQGWVDFDPTNHMIPQLAHITLAWGRDFGDVSPLRGVILGGGTHVLKVGVTVTPGAGASR
jgi:transglutaminase-like putative cysteine protease